MNKVLSNLLKKMKRSLVILFSLSTILGCDTTSNKATEKPIIINAQREAPLGWVYLTIYEDSTFQFIYTDLRSKDRDVYKGKAIIQDDSIHFHYNDSIPDAGKTALIRDNMIIYLDGKYSEKLDVYQNKLSSFNTSNSQDVGFKYKNILEDWIVSFDKDDITRLYGTWQIQEIANISGTVKAEDEIKKQIEKLLIINDSEVKFGLYEGRKIINPEFEVSKTSKNEAQLLKGTSFFHGYRTCRDSVFKLIVFNDESSITFEFIHFREIVYYSDGMLYFLQKLEDCN